MLKKVLIIRFSSIGDIVLTTPIIRCLKNQIPSVEIHYLTKKAFAPIIEANPFVSKVHILDQNLNEIIPLLKTENFDHIIDLHKNIRSGLTILKLRKPSHSFPKINVKKWLSVKLKINKLPDIHIVDRYFKAVEFAKVKNDGLGLDYFIPQKDIVTDLPDYLKSGFIGIVLGSKHNTKQMPEEKILELLHYIQKPVALLGGPEDKEKGEKIIERSGRNDIYNSCGKYSINQSASLVEQAESIIASDTGLMHIAAALKKRIISVWGNTIPEFGMYPYLPDDKKSLSTIFEVKGLSCRPCSKLGFEKCPKGHFNCMMKIDFQQVVNSAVDK